MCIYPIPTQLIYLAASETQEVWHWRLTKDYESILYLFVADNSLIFERRISASKASSSFISKYIICLQSAKIITKTFSSCMKYSIIPTVPCVRVILSFILLKIWAVGMWLCSLPQNFTLVKILKTFCPMLEFLKITLNWVKINRHPQIFNKKCMSQRWHTYIIPGIWNRGGVSKMQGYILELKSNWYILFQYTKYV